LGAVLLFWGWQSGLPLIGAVMGIILESAWLVKVRWDLSDTDFRRILTFCTLFALAATLYVFTATPGIRRGFSRIGPFGGARDGNFQPENVHHIFPLAADVFIFVCRGADIQHPRKNSADGDLDHFALALATRPAARRRPGRPQRECLLPLFHRLPFFRRHPLQRRRRGVFLGQCALIFWALWRFRSRRFGILVWALALAAVLAFGYFGQRGISLLQRYNGGYVARLLAQFMRQWSDPTESITTWARSGIEIVRQNCHPPQDKKQRAAAGISARGQLSRLPSFKTKSWYAGSPRSDFEQNPIPSQTRPDDVDSAV
jgi:hypothetical protein